MPASFTFGLIINPIAGVGGALALKGSDGKDTVAQALHLGAHKQAAKRVASCLQPLLAYQHQLHFITCPNEMGELTLKQLGFSYELLDLPDFNPHASTALDTQNACYKMRELAPDLLLFAGGDGTARDVCAIIQETLPVLGIPAGVKIHSSVYAISPQGASEVLQAFVRGELVNIGAGEVRDLDEQAYRQGQVKAKHFGDMRVPQLGYFVQATKQGGIECPELALEELQAEIENLLAEQQQIEPQTLFLIGAGNTMQQIFARMGYHTSLLGIDALIGERIVCQDMNAAQIAELLEQQPVTQVFISVIGRQGHIIGRGNQPLSAKNLTRIGKSNIKVIATKGKIKSLENRPLVIDSGDATLDKQWAGSIEVITGYQDRILYPLI